MSVPSGTAPDHQITVRDNLPASHRSWVSAMAHCYLSNPTDELPIGWTRGDRGTDAFVLQSDPISRPMPAAPGSSSMHRISGSNSESPYLIAAVVEIHARRMADLEKDRSR
jgi:hypothetical protein